ncbi:HigA family addiction module antitoxin [Mucilaginibacter sp. UYCu711]|uniref:HigA family addiction module antitoxin n=1 Tax=Mucilaginibacter sp. UYCu711 TaxID=3156339 RepID=UPI003D25A5FF
MERMMDLSHPGEILKMELIEGRGLTIGKASGLLGITRPTLSNIMNGKASITPNVALRIETVFGGSAKFWVRLQSSFDLDIAKKVFLENPPKIQHYQVAS